MLRCKARVPPALYGSHVLCEKRACASASGHFCEMSGVCELLFVLLIMPPRKVCPQCQAVVPPRLKVCKSCASSQEKSLEKFAWPSHKTDAIVALCRGFCTSVHLFLLRACLPLTCTQWLTFSFSKVFGTQHFTKAELCFPLECGSFSLSHCFTWL